MTKAVKFLLDNIQYPILFGIIMLGIWLRSIGWNPSTILDYDPHWFVRHAQEILNNGFMPYKWDLLSFFPPGRPTDYYLGWSFIIAIFYKITNMFMHIDLTKFAGIFVAVFASVAAIPAYLVGKHVTNRWGGLATAFFAILTITYMSVSLAGYPDSDSTDLFFTFLAVIATLFAIKKSDKMDLTNFRTILKSFPRYLPYLAPAIISFWLFAVNWSDSWYIYFIFVAFVPVLVIFRMIESLIKGEHKIGIRLVTSKVRENRGLIFAILAIGIIGQLVTFASSGFPFNTITPTAQLVAGLNIIGTNGVALVGFVGFLAIVGAIFGLAFGRLAATVIGGILGIVIAIVLIMSGINGESLIVNQSIAELQPLNIFTQFGQLVGRIGPVPMFLAFAAIGITFLKLIFKKDIHTVEYFAIIWLFVSLFLITKGIRFSLLFSIAVATAAGLTVGNVISFAKQRGSTILLAAAFAFFIIGGIIHFSDPVNPSGDDGVYAFAKAAHSGLDIDQNFQDGFQWLKNNAAKGSLVATWWDPGHIITDTTGLAAMADGAHCPGTSCVFLDHNSRIQDMGRVFAISSETEAVNIMSKYRGITAQQCQELQQKFPDQFTPDACKPVSDIYILATNDLIGKYYWLSYFGTGQGANYIQCDANQQESTRLNTPTYVCSYSVPFEISLVQQNNTVYSLVNSPQQGLRNAPVKDTIIFQNGQQVDFNSGENVTGSLNGLVWTSPNFNQVFLMQPEVRDSIFTNMFFFDGKGDPNFGIPPLKKFKMVYSNAEFKIFKVDFSGIAPNV